MESSEINPYILILTKQPRIYNGKRTTTCKSKKLDHSLTPYTKTHSKWIKDSNVRPETMKLLEENTSRKLLDIGLAMVFWIWQQNKSNESKNKQMGLIKLKSFCTTKETINKMKRQPTERRRKYLQIIYVIRSYHPKYTKNSNSSIPKTPNNPIKNGQRI